MAEDETIDEAPAEAEADETTGGDLPWGWEEAGTDESADDSYAVEIWNDYDPSMRFVVVYTVGEAQGAKEGTVSFTVIEPGKHTGLHHDNAEEILYVSEGVGEAFVSGHQVKLEAGSFYVIARETGHDIYAYGDTELKFLSFHAVPEVVSSFQMPILPIGGTELSSKPPARPEVIQPTIEELDPNNLPADFPFSLEELGMAGAPEGEGEQAE